MADKKKRRQRKSKIIRSIRAEVRKERAHNVISQCSETNCKTYCSDYHDNDPN